MCWMRVLSTTMVLVKWVVAIKPRCVGHHCVVILSLHHHPNMCVCAPWCELRCVLGCAWPMVCVLWLKVICGTCGWLHGFAIHTCPLSVSQHQLDDMRTWWLAIMHWLAVLWPLFFFSLSNHNCLLFFHRPSFLLTFTLHHGCLEMIFWNALDGHNKLLILFLHIPMIDGLRASILWSLDETVFHLYHCLRDIIWCVIHTWRCVILWIWGIDIVLCIVHS